MTKAEVKEFMSRIKAYYRYFDTSDKIVAEEWSKKLEPYNKLDLDKQLEIHLVSENRSEPPMLHMLTKNLLTEEEQRTKDNDYIIACDLCGNWMKLSTYDNIHREKCLCAKTLEKIIEDDEATYDELMRYDLNTLYRVLDKYLPTFNKTWEYGASD